MVRGAWLVDWEQGPDPSYPHCGTGAVDSPPEMQKDRKKGLILGGDYSKALFSLSYSDNSSRILISGERFSTGLFFQRPWSSGIIGRVQEGEAVVLIQILAVRISGGGSQSPISAGHPLPCCLLTLSAFQCKAHLPSCLATLVCVLSTPLFRDIDYVAKHALQPYCRRMTMIAGVSASVHRGHGGQGEEAGA